MTVRPAFVAVLTFTVVALVSAAAVAGWASHGETIFIRLAETGWMTCL